MGETILPSEEHQPELHVRPVEDVAHSVKADERVRTEMKVPPKSETKDSDPRVSALMCTPLLTNEQFLRLTADVEAIVLVAYASGAMPDRLVPAIQQRIQEGTPIFVLSDNPGDQDGIVRIRYAAGKGAYDAGAVPLEKVNVNQQQEVVAAIVAALNKGLRGPALAEEIKRLYAYSKDETRPAAQLDDSAYLASFRERTDRILRLRKERFSDRDHSDSPPK